MSIEKTKSPDDEAAAKRMPVDPRSGGNGDLRSGDAIDELSEDPVEDQEAARGQPGFGDNRVTPHLNDGR